VISAYVERLVDKLSFDRSLSRYVRQEVEDHLWEAVAADDLGDTPEAQRRAVANFGDPDSSRLSSPRCRLPNRPGKSAPSLLR
jgi:hypothetical protein